MGWSFWPSVFDIFWFCIKNLLQQNWAFEWHSLRGGKRCVCIAVVFWSDKNAVCQTLMLRTCAAPPAEDLRWVVRTAKPPKMPVEHEGMFPVFCTQGNTTQWELRHRRQCEEQNTSTSPQILSLKVLGFHSSLCNFAGHFCWFVGFFPQTILSYIFAVSSSHCIPDRAVAPHSLQEWVSSISSCLTFDCHLPLSSPGWCAACNTCNPQNLPFSSTQSFAMGRGYNLEILMKKQQGGIKQTLLLHFDNSEGKLPPGIILLSKSCGGADGQDGNLSCHCSWLRSCLVTFLLCKHLRGNQRMHCSQIRSILHLNT